jgi:uroporphyrinogen decarboxylase
MEAALAGEQIDRPPFSVWTHLPDDDLSAERLTARTLEIHHRLGLDFIKSMPNAYFFGECWGLVADARPIVEGGVAKVVTYPVKIIDDWAQIREVDVRQGALGRELKHLRSLVESVGPDVPVLATVFSPTTVARKIAGSQYREHLAAKPDLVSRALAAITRTAHKFVVEALHAGCAGVYFATQEAGLNAMSADEYRRDAMPSDLEVLSASADAWFNVLHIHGRGIHFDLLEDYPVQALSWHTEDVSPSIESYARRERRKTIVGGIHRGSLTARDSAAVMNEMKSAVEATGGMRLVLSPTCTVHHPFDMDFLIRVSAAVSQLAVAG